MGAIVKFGGAPVWVEGQIEFPFLEEVHGVLVTEFCDTAPEMNTWVGAFSVLDGSGELSIGEYTVISPGVHIYSHVNDLPLKGTDRPVTTRSTKIGSHVYLGPNVVVCAGVEIGDGAVIGAGAYIDNDVPAEHWVTPIQNKRYMVIDEALKYKELKDGK